MAKVVPGILEGKTVQYFLLHAQFAVTVKPPFLMDALEIMVNSFLSSSV